MPASAWRAWILAARIPTLTAAVTPVLVGTAAAARAGGFQPLGATAALVVALALQVGANFANDAFDFLRGADAPARSGPLRVTQSGLLSARQVLTGAYLCFGVAALAGLYFVLVHGWPVLLTGALAIAAGLAYTGGPWPLGYHGLGEVFVFVFFGVVAVGGTAYVQLGRVDPLSLVVSVPVGLTVTAILIVNNLRDIDTDRSVDKRTLAVRLGPRATRRLYAICLGAAAAVPLGMRAAGLIGAGFWLPWLALPLMVTLVRAVLYQQASGPALNRVLKQTTQLHLLFGGLMAVSLLW